MNRVEESEKQAAARRSRRLWSEQGVALIAVMVMLAVIGATAADFAFNARVDYAAAINARDELRAHYLARSSINFARLLLRVQTRLIDPNRRLLGGLDIQVADYAPMLISAFVDKEGAEMLGGLLGVDQADIKGVGVDVGTFDLAMESLDGRVNLNCGGGANPDAPAVIRLAGSLAAMMLPARYDRFFEEADSHGQYNDRLTVLRAIIDWADQDLQMFGSTAAEDYRYNAGDDPYENKNQYYDTLDELRLVRGVDDSFMAAFGDQLTVYGSCKVNVSLADVPTVVALIVQYADSTSDPGLEFRNLALLARYVAEIGRLQGGFTNTQKFVEAVEDPMAQLGMAVAVEGALDQDGGQQSLGLPPVVGVKLSKKIGDAIVGNQPRRIWQLTGSAKVGTVERRIVAVWDQKLVSMQARKDQAGPGGFVYWREE